MDTPTTPTAPAKVAVGPTTIGGALAAVAQIGGAAALMLTGHETEGIAALATGGATLLTILAGRYGQAIALARRAGRGLEVAGQVLEASAAQASPPVTVNVTTPSSSSSAANKPKAVELPRPDRRLAVVAELADAVGAELDDDELDELGHDDEPPGADVIPVVDTALLPPDEGDQQAHDDPEVPSA